MTIIGTVKVFSTKNFGFIERSDGGKDVFFHGSVVEDGVKLTAGDEVEFEVEASDRGPRATAVRLAD